jgi:hypothetical protein
MKMSRKFAALLAGAVACFGLGSCAKIFEVSDPPKNRAVVGDRSLQFSGSPVYEIVEIDGGPIERERSQFGVDMAPGVTMRPGEHLFKVKEIQYTGRDPAFLSFSATVIGGKRYSVIPVKGSPAVVADPPRHG